MDRKVETSLSKILDVLYSLREEQGTVGWSIREALADMLVTPPTKEEVITFLDVRSREAGILTTNEALAKFAGDKDAIDEIWYETKHSEEPIAEFLSLWGPDGKRRGVTEYAPGAGPVWYITPEQYR